MSKVIRLSFASEIVKICCARDWCMSSIALMCLPSTYVRTCDLLDNR